MCRRQPARYPRAVSVPVALALAVAVMAPASAAPVREASSTPAPGFTEPVPKASPGGPAFTTAPAPVPGRARLRGQVLVYGSRDVVFGARILGATADAATATDAEGRFELWLPPGEHALVIRGAGFRDLPIKVTLADGQDLVYEYRLAPDLDGNPYRTVVRQQREVAISSTNLRDDEIHALPGTFGDPFRVVKSLPGASQLAGFLPYVVVRGAAPGNTGYFLDGVRVPILFHVAIGPSVIHPYFIDQVDFYPGGAPTRLGRYVSGMIEGRTKAARRDRNYGEFEIRLTDAGGLVEIPLNRKRDATCRRKKKSSKLDRKALAKIDCRRGEARGSLTLAGRYSYTAGVLTLVQAGARIKFWDYQARFDHKLGPHAQYTAFAYGSFDSIGEKLATDPILQFEFYRVQQRIRQQLPRGGTANYSLAFGLDKSGVTSIKTNAWQIAPRIDVRIPLGERSNGEFGFGIDQEFQIFRVDAASSNANFVENIGVVLSDRFVSATGLYAECCGARARSISAPACAPTSTPRSARPRCCRRPPRSPTRSASTRACCCARRSTPAGSCAKTSASTTRPPASRSRSRASRASASNAASSATSRAASATSSPSPTRSSSPRTPTSAASTTCRTTTSPPPPPAPSRRSTTS
jgi:hypothetical protein